jgi:hypothetical protein
MPRIRCQAPKRASARAQPSVAALASAGVGAFFVNTSDGRVATRTQLAEAGFVDEEEAPVKPWHPIRGPSDASTMWYSILRKRERGVFIGTLCLRHTGRQTLLEQQGWEEMPIERIGVG